MVQMLCVTEDVEACTSLVSGFPGGSEIRIFSCIVVGCMYFVM
jgi:hypothetical protein